MLRKPRRSIRAILLTAFLLFSFAPLAFITGYSFMKYESAIGLELAQRLEGNAREISIIIEEFDKSLSQSAQDLAAQREFSYSLATGKLKTDNASLRTWFQSGLAQRLNVFNGSGQLILSHYKDSRGEPKSVALNPAKKIYLPEATVQQFSNTPIVLEVHAMPSKGDLSTGSMDLIVTTQVKSKSRVVGYVEQSIGIDSRFLGKLRDRMNVELVLLNEKKNIISSSHEDLLKVAKNFFTSLQHEQELYLLELNLRNRPFGFIVYPMAWGNQKFFLSVGSSKTSVLQVVKNLKLAFFSVVGSLVLLVLLLGVLTSRIITRPLQRLVDGINKLDFDKGDSIVEIPVETDTEVGVLTTSFNEMAARISKTQKELKDKIVELEQAYKKLQVTQSQLVHTEKMASLGQLVAGVAHELNNPIGFIYSNMSHLRDYTQRLVKIVEVLESHPKDGQKAKAEAEYEYVVEDMPKLIESCEEGAKRIRDIIQGLRNFSRLDEAQAKKVDIHEGIESTLSLLSGELRGRIEVHKNFAELPKIQCYPSQLNQVFMNILTNAVHAIGEKGSIWITTRLTEDKKTIQISIKDSGKGMPPLVKNKIFDPFFTTKEVGSGTGLGLSISFGIVERHNGRIEVESAVGQGTEFIISLPVT